MDEELKSALAELAAHMNRIEKRLKQAEQVREEVVIPGINELRYAGRRFVDAWAIAALPNPTEVQKQEVRDHIVIARQYLQNADHDVTDAICFFIHREINQMQKRYGADEMIRVFPEYAAFAHHMKEANEIISGSRETRAQRAAAYEQLQSEYVTPLIQTYHNLRFAEGLALKAGKRRKVRNGALGAGAAAGTVYGFWEPATKLWILIVGLF